MKKEYISKATDSPEVHIPKELLPLIEKMAKRVHERWTETRISQGWKYGKQRDDAQKEHPCLIPYEELPEEEKILDRNTSIETLKFILKSGFKIIKE